MENLTWKKEVFTQFRKHTRHVLVDSNDIVYAQIHSSASAGAALFRVFDKPIALSKLKTTRLLPAAKEYGHCKKISDAKIAAENLLEIRIIICPSCKRPINSLEYRETRSIEASVSLIKNDLFFENESNDLEECQYDCPECYHTIVYDRQSALDFLKGEISGE